MRCEVHCSHTDIFINSLKRVADDVRLVQEEKCRFIIIIYLYHFNIFNVAIYLRTNYET